MRIKSKKHREWISTLPCLLCADNTTVECAHVRYPDPRIAKPLTGTGIKPDDCFSVPLCGQHHRVQHDQGDEQQFWLSGGIDPVLVGLALWAVSGDYESGMNICEAVHAA